MTVTKFPQRDMVAEMTGPALVGNLICVDGRTVQKIVMIDRGEMVEFILDGRLSYSFPREWAYLAVSFAFSAMAVGAGFASPGAQHFTQRPFAPTVVQMGEREHE